MLVVVSPALSDRQVRSFAHLPVFGSGGFMHGEGGRGRIEGGSFAPAGQRWGVGEDLIRLAALGTVRGPAGPFSLRDVHRTFFQALEPPKGKGLVNDLIRQPFGLPPSPKGKALRVSIFIPRCSPRTGGMVEELLNERAARRVRRREVHLFRNHAAEKRRSTVFLTHRMAHTNRKERWETTSSAPTGHLPLKVKATGGHLPARSMRVSFHTSRRKR